MPSGGAFTGWLETCFLQILNDLKEAESSESEEQDVERGAVGHAGAGDKEEKVETGQELVMKGEAIEVVEGGQAVSSLFCAMKTE